MYTRMRTTAKIAAAAAIATTTTDNTNRIKCSTICVQALKYLNFSRFFMDFHLSRSLSLRLNFSTFTISFIIESRVHHISCCTAADAKSNIQQ